MGGRKQAVLNIGVAVATFRRPAALARLFGFLPSLAEPPDCTVNYLIVDNDPGESARPVFEAARQALGDKAFYWQEENLGIPFARNRAIDEAVRLGIDLLCFIDDDEVPSREWLARLVQHHRATGAQLIGGPVAMEPADMPLTPWQRIVDRSAAAWTNRKIRRAAMRARHGIPVTVVTNNWLGDMRFITSNDLRFDTGFPTSGGSDTAFFHAAVRRGVRHSWCPEAVVYDHPDAERISLRYHLRRARAQSINHFHQRHPDPDAWIRLRAVSLAALRILTGAMLTIIPVNGAASLVRGVRSIGWGLGRVDALNGKRSEFYKPGATRTQPRWVGIAANPPAAGAE